MLNLTPKFAMKKNYSLLIIIVLLLISACNSQTGTQQTSEYSFKNPDRIWFLPKKLREISGITWLNDTTLICIQDEKANLYKFNLATNEISDKFDFGKDGDYEAITKVNETIYALRSNGNLHAIYNAFSSEINIEKFKTPLTKENDTESLCFLAAQNALLIGCKNLPLQPDNRTELRRAFYIYSLTDSVFIEEPYFWLSAAATNCAKFSPTDMAVNPKNGNIYVLSSSPNCVAVLNTKGEVIYAEMLTHKNFVVPEGICFSPNGTLYIASEGKKQEATLLEFKMNYE
ncbi:MAG TPA: hypothetical protein DCQ31_02030 [Bacteroidales bacterium]|nr:hypothetical protein [Bacteroidales bacterium]